MRWRGASAARGVRFFSALGLVLLALVFEPAVSPAEETPVSGQETTAETVAELVEDPTASLTQIQVKNIYTPSEYGTDAQPNTVQLRAVIASSPHLLLPFDHLIRPTMKVVTVPTGEGTSTTTAYDDMQLFDLVIARWPDPHETNFRWGIGPYMVLPTATSHSTGKEAWQMGPAFGFAYRAVAGLKISGLLQQATSFAYTSPHAKPVTSLTYQPILSYQLGGGWYVKSSDATWTFNLRRETSTTIPLSAGFGKVWKLSDGFAIDTSASGEWMVYRQSANRTEQFSLNFQITLLLPRARL
jgi:hypothetical protein